MLTDACAVCHEPIHFHRGVRVKARVHDKPLGEMKVSPEEHAAVMERAQARKDFVRFGTPLPELEVGQLIHEAQPTRDYGITQEIN